MLEESMVKFDNEDDIYLGIEAAIDKLNHYYDKISPMVGISLLLHSSYKKRILIESQQWKQEWVDSVMDHFYSSFRYYRSKLVRTSDISPAVTTPDFQPEGIYKYFNEPLAMEGTNVVNTFLFQLTVLVNYQNGKDTHIRAVKLWQMMIVHYLQVLSHITSHDINL